MHWQFIQSANWKYPFIVYYEVMTCVHCMRIINRTFHKYSLFLHVTWIVYFVVIRVQCAMLLIFLSGCGVGSSVGRGGRSGRGSGGCEGREGKARATGGNTDTATPCGHLWQRQNTGTVPSTAGETQGWLQFSPNYFIWALLINSKYSNCISTVYMYENECKIYSAIDFSMTE